MEVSSGSSTCADHEHELVISLTTFVQLYDQHDDALQRALQRFMQTAARVHKRQESFKDFRDVVGAFGGALGALFGGVTGGIWGALGGVGATMYRRLCGDVNTVGVTVGVVSGILGGAVGGAVSGAAGSVVVVAAEATGTPVHGVASDVLWFTVGFAVGFAIGGAGGDDVSGLVGPAGAAVGGGLGAVHGTSAAVHLVRKFVDCPPKDFKKEGKQMEVVAGAQETGRALSESIKPLLQELKALQQICDNMASSDAVKSVAGQTAKTLTAVASMERSMSDSQSATDLHQFACCVTEAARHCEVIPEELSKARVAVERLLLSLRKR